ncbi:MAG: HAMP domain-containing protein [Deltaproteobacteria bacterium]|nr:HAMP domain-containing protein [Deltaproteobacteria bacterium]
MRFNFLTIFGSTYRFRVFLIFAIYIALISASFTAFFINHQSNQLRAQIINAGTILSENLALNSRIAVFTENKKLLNESISGILQQHVVLEASLHDAKGTCLAVARRPGQRHDKKPESPEIPLFDKKQTLPFFQERKDGFEFWSGINTATSSFEEENLNPEMMDNITASPVIGYARLLIDTRPLRDQLHALLYESILIGTLFLIGCFCGAYLLARMVTNPIQQLTNAVETLGSKGVVEKVAITSDDELGNLARAFNTMAESLRNREQRLEESKSRLRKLSALVLNAQEEERRRLARELHDDLGQALAFLKIQTYTLAQKLRNDQHEIKDDCRNIDLYIEQIIENIRRLSRDLSPVVLEDLGLTEALKILSKEFSNHYRIDLIQQLTNIDYLLTPTEQINLYRFCQEALTNIHKHARANKISVVVEYINNYITVTITDDGRGFDVVDSTEPDRKLRGMGLTTLEERATMLQGTFTIRSSPGRGTDVILKIPITVA